MQRHSPATHSTGSDAAPANLRPRPKHCLEIAELTEAPESARVMVWGSGHSKRAELGMRKPQVTERLQSLPAVCHHHSYSLLSAVEGGAQMLRM